MESHPGAWLKRAEIHRLDLDLPEQPYEEAPETCGPTV